MSILKRIVASALSVVMLFSALATLCFAKSEVDFLGGYSCGAQEGLPVISDKAVIVTSKIGADDITNKNPVTESWDGKKYTFYAGVNAFNNFADAYSAASSKIGAGEVAQVLFAAGEYSTIKITGPVQIFGVDWAQDPNVKNPKDLTQEWTLNPKYTDSDTTKVHDIVIDSGANTQIGIYGFELLHRFYDIYRPVSGVKTVLTIQNMLVNVTDTTTEILYNSKTGRGQDRNARCAFSFWNENSHDQTRLVNKDETYLKNIYVKTLMLDRGDKDYTLFQDEMVSPTFVLDNFYAEKNNGMTRFSYVKWRGNYKNTLFAIRNSYITDMEFQVQGFAATTLSPDVANGERSTFELTGNVLNKLEDDILVEQQYYSNVNINKNLVICNNNEKFPVTLKKAMPGEFVVRDNTFIGSVGMKMDFKGSIADVTGSYITSQTTDYLTSYSTVAPSGDVEYDYFYLDGARTQKSNDIQQIQIEQSDIVSRVDVNKQNGTANVVVNAGEYTYLLNQVNPNVTVEIYESDKDFSNASDYADSTKLTNELALKNDFNYYILVAYSAYPSKVTNQPDVYKLTVERQDAELGDFNIDNGIKNGKEITIYAPKGETSVDITAHCADGVQLELYNKDFIEIEGTTLKVSNNRKQAAEYIARLSKADAVEYYTIYVRSTLNSECDILDISLIKQDGKYVAYMQKTSNSLSFDITVSEGAFAWVNLGTAVYGAQNGKITISDLQAGTYQIGVESEDGKNTKTFELVVKKYAVSNNAEVLSIEGALETDSGFVSTIRRHSSTSIRPVVSDFATYQIFLDDKCTQVANDVSVTDKDAVYYIKVTAEDKVTQNIVKWTVKVSDDGISVKNANDGTYFISAEANLSYYHLEITAKNCTYKLYADSKKTLEASPYIKLETAYTSVVCEVTYQDGFKENIVITVHSKRPVTHYADSASIPGWAKTHLDALNNAGYGLFVGDQNGNFNASKGLTRFEIAALATRVLGIDANQYKNVEISYADKIAPWAQSYVKAVTSLGIMGGSYNQKGQLVFKGEETATRAELSKVMVQIIFIANGYTKTAEVLYNGEKAEIDYHFNSFGFKDTRDIPAWAKTYVKLAVCFNIYQGSYENGNLYINPNQNIKRQEMAAVVSRFVLAK